MLAALAVLFTTAVAGPHEVFQMRQPIQRSEQHYGPTGRRSHADARHFKPLLRGISTGFQVDFKWISSGFHGDFTCFLGFHIPLLAGGLTLI